MPTKSPMMNPPTYIVLMNTPPALSLQADSRTLSTTAPMESPASGLDSGVCSPKEGDATGRHPIKHLDLHHFRPPFLTPSAPPNSPQYEASTGEFDDDIEIEPHEGVSSSLDGRLAVLNMPKKIYFSSAEIAQLQQTVPKAPENEYYEIRAVPGKGYGCFAIKPIQKGARILADSPLLVVLVAEYLYSDVQAAFDKLSPAEQALYFQLHSAHNQDPANWPRRIHPGITDRERQRIEEQHNARVGKEASLISIFQTNCMEKDGGAAVFPHAARFNHSCNPNACFAWNANIEKETIHAIQSIDAGEQITLAYVDTTHNKATRAWVLKHYGFVCDCPACDDHGNDPDSFAARSAARRFQLREMQEEFKKLRGQNLELGAQEEGFVQKLLLYAKLLVEEGDCTGRLATVYLDLALLCERVEDWNWGLVCAEKALQTQVDCYGDDSPGVHNFRSVVKRIKQRAPNGTAKGEAQ